ncbi:MAG: hydrogenase nickel incorporation protein HypB [Burkholderiales bacterium]
MCKTCGCGIPAGHAHAAIEPSRNETVRVMQSLLHRNDAAAARNRALFDASGTLVLNLMSSPGSGKTALLEATIDAMKAELRIAVIEGDLETERDAERIRARGVPAVQITTGTACHLDAEMVHGALRDLVLDDIDILFIENVGNLVCPASFDLGQHFNVTLLAATEGDDKPAKYPVIFRAADLVLITKTDLLPALDDFDPARAEAFLRGVASRVPLLQLSARKRMGLQAWFDWLRARRIGIGRTARNFSYRPHDRTAEPAATGN